MIIAPIDEYSSKVYQYSNDLEQTETRRDKYAAFGVRLRKGAEVKAAEFRHGLLSDAVEQQRLLLSDKETMGVRFLQQRYAEHIDENPDLYHGCLLVPKNEDLARCLDSASAHRPLEVSTRVPCEKDSPNRYYGFTPGHRMLCSSDWRWTVWQRPHTSAHLVAYSANSSICYHCSPDMNDIWFALPGSQLAKFY